MQLNGVPAVRAALAAGDYDGDGLIDVGAWFFSRHIGWYRSAPAAPFAASVSVFGSGCGSPPMSVVPLSNPLIGSVIRVRVDNVPTALCWFAMGFSDVVYGGSSLPASLAPLGMPGCDLLVAPDLVGLATEPTGVPHTRGFSYAIPNLGQLLGLRLYGQGVAYAPAVNPLQLVVSDALDWLLGNV